MGSEATADYSSALERLWGFVHSRACDSAALRPLVRASVMRGPPHFETHPALGMLSGIGMKWHNKAGAPEKPYLMQSRKGK